VIILKGHGLKGTGFIEDCISNVRANAPEAQSWFIAVQNILFRALVRLQIKALGQG
jgi:hypothetical protein